jgi:hypothetical protein
VALAVSWPAYPAAAVEATATATAEPAAQTQPVEAADIPPQADAMGRPVVPVTPSEPDVPEALTGDAAVLAALDAADFHERDEATRALLQDATRGVAALKAMYRAAESPEARHRVLGVLRHRFLAEQAEAMFPGGGHGAIGVSHRAYAGGGGASPGAEVVSTLPGFPGHAVLHRGDVITAVEGRPLAGDEGVEVLSQRVRQMRHGEAIGLTVERSGRPRQVRLTLGSMNALVAMYGGDALGEPFRSRWAAVVTELGEPGGSGGTGQPAER